MSKSEVESSTPKPETPIPKPETTPKEKEKEIINQRISELEYDMLDIVDRIEKIVHDLWLYHYIIKEQRDIIENNEIVNIELDFDVVYNMKKDVVNIDFSKINEDIERIEELTMSISKTLYYINHELRESILKNNFGKYKMIIVNVVDTIKLMFQLIMNIGYKYDGLERRIILRPSNGHVTIDLEDIEDEFEDILTSLYTYVEELNKLYLE